MRRILLVAALLGCLHCAARPPLSGGATPSPAPTASTGSSLEAIADDPEAALQGLLGDVARLPRSAEFLAAAGAEGLTLRTPRPEPAGEGLVDAAFTLAVHREDGAPVWLPTLEPTQKQDRRVPASTILLRAGNATPGEAPALFSTSLRQLFDEPASVAPGAALPRLSDLGDAEVQLAAQAVYLPVPPGAKVSFTPVVSGRRGVDPDAAVLVVAVSRQGTSLTLVEADAQGNLPSRELHFNAGGQRTAFTAEWKREVVARIEAQGGPRNEDERSAMGDAANVLFLIEIPLRAPSAAELARERREAEERAAAERAERERALAADERARAAAEERLRAAAEERAARERAAAAERERQGRGGGGQGRPAPGGVNKGGGGLGGLGGIGGGTSNIGSGGVASSPPPPPAPPPANIGGVGGPEVSDRQASGEAPPETGDAVIGHGAPLGAWELGDGSRYRADTARPVRVTVQLYRATAAPLRTVAALDPKGVAATLRAVFEHPGAATALLVSADDDLRDADAQNVPPEWFPWLNRAGAGASGSALDRAAAAALASGALGVPPTAGAGDDPPLTAGAPAPRAERRRATPCPESTHAEGAGCAFDAPPSAQAYALLSAPLEDARRAIEKRQRQTAEGRLGKVLTAFAESGLATGSEAAEFPAEAQYLLAQYLASDVVAARLRGDPQHLKADLAALMTAVQKAQTAFGAVARFGRLRWSLQALERSAVVLETLAAKVRNAPPPAQLDRDQREVYAAALGEQAARFEQMALDLHRQLVEAADRARVSTPAVEKSRQRLAARR